MTVEGCLTASGDRFVLTELNPEATTGTGPTAGAAQPGTTQPAESQRADSGTASRDFGTEAYRLVGMDDELRPHVGKRVRISGEGEPEQVVDLRQSTPPSAATPPAGSTQPGRTNEPAGTTGPDAQVGTTSTARIEISDLQVRSVMATNEPCGPSR